MSRLKQLLLSLPFLLFGFTSTAIAEGELEEIVVTGSYLKRTAQDSPSPLSVVTSADIEDLGAADVAEIVQAMPWQSGSQTRASTFGGEGADGRNSINLRNLGHGSTLPLVNGKRHVASWYNGRGNASVNINGLVPNIALERVEIVKDGASALYGSDAIAGVANLITKKDFEGFDVNYQYSVDDESGEGQANTLEFIYGLRGSRGGVTISASQLNRDEIHVGHRYDRFGGSTISGTGQPGRIIPIEAATWAAHGLFPGQPVGANGEPGTFPRDALGNTYGQADVDCEVAATEEVAGTLGTAFGNLLCIYDYGPFFALQAEEHLSKVFITGDYELNDNVELYFEFANNDQEFDRKNSLNPNSPALPIAATHPGNIEDAFRRGIEPITVLNATRMLGLTRYNPDRPIDTKTRVNYADSRAIIGAISDFELGGRPWTLDVSYSANEHDRLTSQIQDTQSSHMKLAIIGLGGPFCDIENGTPGEGNLAYAASGGDFAAGQCYYFNPFGNSRWNRTGGRQTDLTLTNPDELLAWMVGRANSQAAYRQRTWDAVATGELFDMNSQPVQIALGFQRRVEIAEELVSSDLNSDNLDFVFGARDWNGQLTTTALFGEISLPVADWMDINLAVRYEDFDEIGEDTTDPKITIHLRPTDDLALRLSAGSSYRVPSLLQLFGSLTTVANQTDYTGVAAFRPSVTTGNDSLVPESADNWNIGLSWAPSDGPLAGFQADVDIYQYEYEDIITRQGSQTLLNEDNAAINAFLAANPGSTGADAVAAGVGNPEQIIRDSQANLVRILPDFLNANSAEIGGVDVTTSYTIDTDMGTFRPGLQVAYVTEYEVDVPNSNGVGSTTFDAVGQFNAGNPVARPLPEYKINATLNWSMDNHRAFLIVKHTPEVEDDRGAGTWNFFATGIGLANGAAMEAEFRGLRDSSGTFTVESFTTADVQYTYNFGELSFLADTSVTLGIMNITNEEPPFAVDVTAYSPILHDPRGRIFMFRVNGSF